MYVLYKLQLMYIFIRVSPTGDDRMSGKGNAATLPGISSLLRQSKIIIKKIRTMYSEYYIKVSIYTPILFTMIIIIN